MRKKQNNETADMIVYNGKIASSDAQGNFYSALAVQNDKISALGTEDEILKLKTDKTCMIDLCGRTVVPGLNDTHTHFSGAALSELNGELFVPESVEELLSNIKNQVKKTDRGQWLHFRNTYPTRLDEYRFPTLEELDDAAPENPVYVDAAYAGKANSCAMKMVGIDENTVPTTGKLGKDPRTGNLNGTLFLCGSLIHKHLKGPEHSLEDRICALKKLQREYNKLGLTSIILGGTSRSDVEAFAQMYKENSLSLRMVYTHRSSDPGNVESEIENLMDSVDIPPEWGKLGFLKVSLDGGILTGTAYMRKPYGKGWKPFGIDDENFRGIINLTKEQLEPFVKHACRLNLQMTAHCIGDAATDRLLSAYETVNKEIPLDGKRFSFIHADFTDKTVLKKIAGLGLILISQPAWHYKDGSILNQIMDGETMASFLPYKDMQRLGVSFCGGSDHMAKHDSFASQNPYNPFLGMYNLITRKTCKGDLIGEEQAISRRQALAAYTSRAAFASFDEEKKGTLQTGKLADMAVLSEDFFTCPEESIPHIESECTIIGGKIVYSNK